MKEKIEATLGFNISEKYDQSVPLIFSLCIPDGCTPSNFNKLAHTLSLPVEFNDVLCQSKNKEEPLDAYQIFTL